MKLNKLVLLTAIFFSSSPTFAGPGGGHKHSHDDVALEDKLVVEGHAKEELPRLIESGKLDASWKAGIKVKSVDKKQYKKKWEWLVIFENPAVKKNGTLYVFLKPSGEFLAANHTGK